MNIAWMFGETIVNTIRDVLPIASIIALFQLIVLRRPIANLPRLLWGFAFVILGLASFLLGLEIALFPLGEAMAEQLTKGFVTNAQRSTQTEVLALHWSDFYLTYLFAFSLGTSTTIAEPALIAVAMKAQEVSGGAIQSWGLRLAVALGVGSGVAIGTFRIVTGVPLPYFILAGYALVVVQTYYAPKSIIPIAYDSGGVATSTVTVPLIVALGLGLASRIPGRDPTIDGFGMVAFACLPPMITVMGYAQLAHWFARRAN